MDSNRYAYFDKVTGEVLEELPPAGPLLGLTIVFTGDFDVSREDLWKLVADNGGAPKSSVSRKTDYLVTGDGSGSKLVKAQEYGIPIITLDQLQGMIDYGEKACSTER